MNEINFNTTDTFLNSTATTTATILHQTISSIPSREQYLIDAFNRYIQIGIGSLLFFFGVTFNCLSLLYFHVSRSFRHTTFRLYFSIIAILDTIRLFEFLIFLLFDKGYLKVTLTLCRSIFFTIMFTGQASIWLTVALAIEKCVIILFPIKGRLCFTVAMSKIVLVFVLLLVLFADIIYLLPNFFLHTYENMSIHTFMCVWQKGGQTSDNSVDEWKKHYFTFNTIFFHSIIPSIILLISNSLIICSLSQQRLVLTKIGSIDAKNVLKREKQFKEKTIQLVLSSFFVIITISPRYILTMVNAFSANFSNIPLMPLYIYVNLNTVFRVLEMCNYSLNIIIAIMSGRTSRQEIRKLLWECLLWRIQRIEVDQSELKLPAHSFSVDDDDDTDRSAQNPNSLSYTVFLSKYPNRHQNLSPKSSFGTHSLNQTRSLPPTTPLFLTCCGFTIDLSHKQQQQQYSNQSRSTMDVISARPSFNRRSTTTQLQTKKSLSAQSSVSSHDQFSRQARSISYRTGNTHRSLTRRRAQTVVHCSRNRHFTPITTLINSKQEQSALTPSPASVIEIC